MPPSPPRPPPPGYILFNNDSALARALRAAGVPPGIPLLVAILLASGCVCCACAALAVDRRLKKRGEPGLFAAASVRSGKLRDAVGKYSRRARDRHREASSHRRRRRRGGASAGGSGARSDDDDDDRDEGGGRRAGDMELLGKSGGGGGGGRGGGGGGGGSASLPPDWELEHDEDGREYYWNTRMRTATWTRPTAQGGLQYCGGVPPGWTEHSDAAGNIYYANERDRSATWTHPAMAQGRGAGGAAAGRKHKMPPPPPKAKMPIAVHAALTGQSHARSGGRHGGSMYASQI